MDPIVLIMVLSIYTGAIAAPLSLFFLARRTGHGPAWQAGIALCAAFVWVALILGFLREFLDVAISRDLLEIAGLAAVLSFAALALVGLVMATKAWPEADEAAQKPRYHGARFSPFAADIE